MRNAFARGTQPGLFLKAGKFLMNSRRFFYHGVVDGLDFALLDRPGDGGPGAGTPPWP